MEVCESWFNRLRASLNRARAGAATAAAVANDEYSAALTRSFDDHLGRLGTKGTKFESFCTRISECLASDKHGEFCEGLEKLGILLGYRPAGRSTRPLRTISGAALSGM